MGKTSKEILSEVGGGWEICGKRKKMSVKQLRNV